jgi:hypothetical protein
MQKLMPQIRLFSATCAIAILCTGCGGGRVAQCNRMVKVANQVTELSQDLTNANKSQDAEILLQATTEAEKKLDKMSKEMQALDISDMKLKVFRLRFVDVYIEAKNSFGHIADAVKTKNMTLVYQATAEGKIIDSRESALVSEVNKYCSGK